MSELTPYSPLTSHSLKTRSCTPKSSWCTRGTRRSLSFSRQNFLICVSVILRARISSSPTQPEPTGPPTAPTSLVCARPPRTSSVLEPPVRPSSDLAAAACSSARVSTSACCSMALSAVVGFVASSTTSSSSLGTSVRLTASSKRSSFFLSRSLPCCWCCCEALVTRPDFPLKESVLCWREAEVVRSVVRRLGGMMRWCMLMTNAFVYWYWRMW